MKSFGITGTIGSGKSTLSILLRRRQLPVFNADAYSRTAFQKTASTYAMVVNQFGTAILDNNGEIDRKALHFLGHHSQDALVFAEVPLLFEAGWETLFDEVIVVTCEKETALQRLIEDRGFSRQQALARLDHQIDPGVQIAKADMVFHNDGSIRELEHPMETSQKKQRNVR